MLSMTTDYQKDTGCPQPYLAATAEAGFTHVHWCHHWNSDFLYSRSEVDQIRSWMKEYGLQLTDLHASGGQEKNWLSPREYERRAGVELVANRIGVTADLGGDVAIVHIPAPPADPALRAASLSALQRSLADLEPLARKRGVRLAIENLAPSNFVFMQELFSMYSPDFLGLCYDSGHGNMIRNGLDGLDRVKDRLISLHLHDNDGEKDLHRLLFSGTVDWPRLARLIAESSYTKCVSMEVVMRNTGLLDPKEFLRQAHETGQAFSEMVDRCRNGGLPTPSSSGDPN